MRVNTSRIRVSHIALESRLKGSPVTDLTGSGDVRCSRSKELHMFGYPDELLVAHGMEPNRPVSQRVFVRCRKCPECLRHRARLWTARAMDETKVSVRTWFGTLTVSPERQTWARYSALKTIQRRMSDNTDETVFAGMVNVIGKELTLYLKRLRKVAPVRYLLVTEAHKSGLPHFHMLVHEYSGSISKRVLEDRWRFGFSHWRLIPPGNEAAAGYVCKYLAKDARTRVRASEHYGQRSIELVTERMVQATRVIADAIRDESG